MNMYRQRVSYRVGRAAEFGRNKLGHIAVINDDLGDLSFELGGNRIEVCLAENYTACEKICYV